MFKTVILSLVVVGCMACNNSGSKSNENDSADTDSDTDSDTDTDADADADTDADTDADADADADTDADTDAIQGGAAVMAEFGEITLQPTHFFAGWGDNVDAITAWKSGSGDTQIFVTSKDSNEVGRFNLDGTLVKTYPQESVNGAIVFENEIYLTQDNGDHTVFVYDASTLTRQRTFSGEADMPGGGEHDLDICPAESAGGKNVAWVSDDSGTVVAYDALSGQKLYAIDTGIAAGLEEIEVIAHNGHCTFVVANENLDNSFGFQVWRANTTEATKIGEYGKGRWQDDSEGLVAVTALDGSGYLFSTEQGPNQSKYHVYHFDATGSTFTFAGTLILEDIAKTDGISAFQWPAPDAPEGMFLAIDNDTQGVAIPLHIIFEATGLGLDG